MGSYDINQTRPLVRTYKKFEESTKIARRLQSYDVVSSYSSKQDVTIRLLPTS